MPALEQMANRECGPAAVVRDHAVGVEVARPAVDEHECGSGAAFLVEVAVIVACRDDNDAVDSTFTEGSDQLSFAIRVLVAAAGEDEDAAPACSVLDTPVQRRRERVRHVLEDESDRLRLPTEAAERRGVCVTPVVELLD